jgi:hypothetical protein
MGLTPRLVKPDYYVLTHNPNLFVSGDTPEKVIEEFSKSAMYDRDWNWLMPVVEKIESLNFKTTITNHICRIERVIFDDIVFSEDMPKIQAVYNACVEFIKWYNQQKPKQYPFKEGDDYWVIEDNEVVWSCWDDISEQLHDENPNKIYYKSEEDAHEALLNLS